MLVLSIIGIVIVLIIISIYVKKFDEACFSRFNTEFFTWGKFSAVAFANWMLYFGNSWYQDSLINNGDPINGLILAVIAIVIYILWFYLNVKETNLLWGIFGSIISAIIFLPASILAVAAVFMAYALIVDTKPVINLN